MGLAVLMGAQTPAMATEISQEAATQEQQIVEPQTEVPLAEEVETTEVQMEEISTEKVETEENQTEEAQSETQTIEVQAETQAEEIQTQELENTEPQQTEEQKQETSTEASTEGLIDQYALTETQEVLTDGWHQDSDGNCMYVKDGAYLTDTVAEINGNYYGFDYNGIMYADTYFDLWDSESQRWVYYRAKSDGSLYVNEWYFQDEDSHMAPYYYGGGMQKHIPVCTKLMEHSIILVVQDRFVGIKALQLRMEKHIIVTQMEKQQRLKTTAGLKQKESICM